MKTEKNLRLKAEKRAAEIGVAPKFRELFIEAWMSGYSQAICEQSDQIFEGMRMISDTLNTVRP